LRAARPCVGLWLARGPARAPFDQANGDELALVQDQRVVRHDRLDG
jgi:hypothetical protein